MHGTFQNNGCAARNPRRDRRSCEPRLLHAAFSRAFKRQTILLRRPYTFNKNFSTSFELLSPVCHGYVPIGWTRSGDGATARLSLVTAGCTALHSQQVQLSAVKCNRASQSRQCSFFVVLMSIFFFLNRSKPARPSANRSAIADRVDRYVNDNYALVRY